MTAYLNHAGTSWPKPQPVQQAMSAALTTDPLDWPATFEQAHRQIAAFWGIDQPAKLLLTPGCTSALAVAVADLPWQPGDVAVTSGLEHHALHRPLLALAARGVKLEVIPPAGAAPLDLARLEEVLGAGRVRLLAVSLASNVSGAVLPIEALVTRAHAAGALVLLDAAQAAGWLPLDVAQLGADMLAFAGHKALQGPWGLGGLYSATPLHASPRLQGAAPTPGYCDTGSVDRVALAGLVAGMHWLQRPAQRQRLARARRQIAQLQAIAQRYGARVIGPADVELRLPTLALVHPRHEVSALASALRRHGVVASGGHQCAFLAHRTLATNGVLRLSVGPTTRDEEIDRAGEALAAVLS